MKDQFNDSYKIEIGYTDNPGNLKKQYFIEDQQKHIQSEIVNRPSNIKFFEDIIYRRDFSEKLKPRVGYFCNMIPVEIILALDAEPVRLDCGNSATALVGEEVFSGEICPLAKASFGSLLRKGSLTDTCDIFIVPTSCDAKRKMGEFLSDHKPIFMFNLPHEKNYSLYSKFSYEEILRLVDFLSSHLKSKLSRKKLFDIIKLKQKQTTLLRKLQEIRIKMPEALNISDLFLIVQSSLFYPNDLSQWITETEKVLEEISEFKPERKNLRPRIVLTGAPMVWPNFKVLNIIDECGADVVADTLCTGVQSCFDPVVIDEKSKKALLRALINRYVFASICPCFISQTSRINRVLDLVEETKADGVINYSLRLCQIFDLEKYRLDKVVKQNKITYMNINTDYSLEDKEQLRVRIEAFLETL